ncbi:hypothetical protein Sfum_2269 [Syntrophobacter fumaroxidans MPOB]|uniref:Uncharacterized protein n=1 Tax=Syntrophobacter fumaroxidans (strain DSM 10017 / MPOB) TaxID=335543 RepID=A0LKJ9_SYNFM|nr:hypothetical protein Sfum_2269 [Syntrophobacter fumaroxidans MPOB]
MKPSCEPDARYSLDNRAIGPVQGWIHPHPPLNNETMGDRKNHHPLTSLESPSASRPRSRGGRRLRFHQFSKPSNYINLKIRIWKSL